MTKKLENLFDLPADLGPGSSDSSFKVLHDTEMSQQAKQQIQEQKNVIAQVDDAIDKIDIALPTVRDLEASDQEMDDLAACYHRQNCKDGQEVAYGTVAVAKSKTGSSGQQRRTRRHSSGWPRRCIRP